MRTFQVEIARADGAVVLTIEAADAESAKRKARAWVRRHGNRGVVASVKEKVDA